MSKSRFFVTLLAGLAVFALAFTTARNPSDPVPVPSKTVQLVSEDFGSWQYIAFREGYNLVLQLKIKNLSAQGLEEFRQANEQLAQELATQQISLDANVILKYPISLEALAALVEHHSLDLKSVEMRVIDGYGDRVTLVTGPEGDSLISDNFVQSTVGWVEEDTGAAQLLGVVSIQGTISSGDYSALSAEPAVFAVDVTRDYARYHMVKKHSALIQRQDIISVAASSGYWYVEDYVSTAAK
ncbi:MAG: hypothetical protein MN733_43110 [Nitrososphaera sp.]|nr:hypothetical protein [Nitrososphaera sp.]